MQAAKSTFGLILLAGVVFSSVLLPCEPVQAKLRSEEALRDYPNSAVIEAWVAPDHFASRDELIDATNAGIFGPNGPCAEFALKSVATRISVDDHLDTEWASRTPVGSNSRQVGEFYFVRLGDLFEPGENIQLNVFFWEGNFISRICANFAFKPPHRCPDAVARDAKVEQDRRAGAPTLLDASLSLSYNASPLTHVWREAGKIIAGPTSESRVTRILPLGEHHLELTVDDGHGCAGTDTAVITVQDTTPPDLTVPADIKTEQSTSAGTMIPFSVSAFDICDANPDIVSTPPSGTTFPLGTTEVVSIAMDASGNKTEKRFNVTIEDNTPPDVNIEIGTALLWPPKHDLRPVDLLIDVFDICDADPTLKISITQDEPVEDKTGDGKFSPDAKLKPDPDGGPSEYLLRAECKGNGDGRVYLIIATATDASGHVTQVSATVIVPKSRSPRDIKAANEQAAAALAAGVPLEYDSFDGPEIGPYQ